MCHLQAAFYFLLGLIFVQSGEAIQCWKCASDFDMTCRDHFNITKIMQTRQYTGNVDYGSPQIQPVRNNPHLEVCDDRYTGTYNQKNVCMKRVYKGNNGLPIVVRECRLVSRNLKVGQCPDEIYADKGRSVEFCGTCEYDGCNGASGLTGNTLFAGLVPAICLLFLKK